MSSVYMLAYLCLHLMQSPLNYGTVSLWSAEVFILVLSHHRIMTFASLATIQRVMSTRWRSWAWVWMMRATAKLQPPCRVLVTHAVLAFSAAFSLWYMLASAAMPTAHFHPVKR